MYNWIPFWPHTASDTAVAVNNLFIAELALGGLIMATVVGMMVVFCIRYRRGSSASRADLTQKTWHFEAAWTTATLGVFLILFVWGAQMYVWLFQAPKGDEEIYVVAKRWMWKVEHPGGQSEIDALHVPVNKTIRLTMASEDVIHSFFVPAFRVKHDVVPGTLETHVVQAGQGRHLRLRVCAVLRAPARDDEGQGDFVMSGPDYARWLKQEGVQESLAQQGEKLFRARGCSGCHGANSTVHAPSLAGLYGTMVHMQDGSVRLADETYIHDCILNPRSFTVAGYPPIMPDFSGQLSEGDVMKLIAFIKSLGNAQETGK